MFQAVQKYLIKKIEETGAQYKAYGIFGIFNFPIYYITWLYLSPQTYENLTLRIISTVLCFFLAVHNKWPNRFKKFLRIYWYFTLAFTLPFFFTFMLLMNHGSTMWVTNTIVIVFFVLLLVEWLSAIILLLIGSAFGIFVASFFTESFFPASFDYTGFFITYFIAIIIGTIFTHNKQIIEKLKRQSMQVELKAKQAHMKMEMAAQVSHDIRSPLAALNTVLRNLPTIAEDQRILIRNAVRRINDIANNLLVEYRGEMVDTKTSDKDERTPSTQKAELLSSLLDILLSEKKAQMGDRRVELNLDIEADAFGLFVTIESMQFKRVISNLLNNAIEAIEGTGDVTVRLEKQSEQARICLIDTGKGIPPVVLDKIKDGGITHGKTGGTGIGIASAIELIERCGGHFNISSQVARGTTVTIDIPFAPAPDWFQEALVLIPRTTVVVLDDDESIHAIWTSRCRPFLGEITLKHIHHSKTFREYCAAADLSQSLFLVDYELLGSDETGLDLIEQLNLNDRAILVTSRYEESKVREQAKRLDVKIIPKNFSPYISIMLANQDQSQEQPKLVFIDDDNTLTRAWEQAAVFADIFIKTFNRTADLRKALPTLAKSTPIYIDSNLRESISGEVFAKELFDRGFTELYLASGHPKGHFGDLPWIKDFVEKEPPF